MGFNIMSVEGIARMSEMREDLRQTMDAVEADLTRQANTNLSLSITETEWDILKSALMRAHESEALFDEQTDYRRMLHAMQVYTCEIEGTIGVPDYDRDRSR